MVVLTYIKNFKMFIDKFSFINIIITINDLQILGGVCVICDECGINPATTHLTKIVNGKKTELHLCEICAKKNKEINFDSPFSIHQLLAGLLDNISEGTKKVDFVSEFRCNYCGISYNNFRKNGKFGCSECYNSFSKQLAPLLKRIHGHENHVGKIPNKASSLIKTKREIQRLRKELSLAVEREEYERAAELRDIIRSLQNKLNE